MGSNLKIKSVTMLFFGTLVLLGCQTQVPSIKNVKFSNMFEEYKPGLDISKPFESLDTSCAASLVGLPCSTLRGTISSHEAFFRFCPDGTGDERLWPIDRRGDANRMSDLPRSTRSEGAGEEGDSCGSGPLWS